MRSRNLERPHHDRETQLCTIRDLMLTASRRGAWLTLGEIAGLTEIGEASISAQLRHLRKIRYGRHRVEKRVRPSHPAGARVERHDEARPAVWEYRVLPAAAGERTPSESGDAATDARIFRDSESCADHAGNLQHAGNPRQIVDLQQAGPEVRDAEARD